VIFMEIFSWTTNTPKQKEVECHTVKIDSWAAVFRLGFGEYADGTPAYVVFRNSLGSFRKRWTIRAVKR
jgi:hypothetical protein